MARIEKTYGKGFVDIVGIGADQIIAISAEADKIGVPVEYVLYISLLDYIRRTPGLDEAMGDYFILGLAYFESSVYKARERTVKENR